MEKRDVEWEGKRKGERVNIYLVLCHIPLYKLSHLIFQIALDYLNL